MADLETIDHRTASELLTPRYRTPLFVGLLESWLKALNEVDETLVEMQAGMTDIDEVIGNQLEILRRIVGAMRILSDEDLQRVLVRTEILARRSSGNMPDLLQILDVIFPGDDVALVELFPATLKAGPIYSTTEDMASVVLGVLDRARAAAVRLDLTWSSAAAAATFRFSTDDSPEADAAIGWADDGQTVGGVFADALTSE